jgi:hypothetical protein
MISGCRAPARSERLADSRDRQVGRGRRSLGDQPRPVGRHCLEEVARQAHVNGSRAAAGSQGEGAGDVVPERVDALGEPRGFRDRERGADLIHLLKGAGPELAPRRVAAQQDDGRLGHQGAVEGRDGVAVAGTGRDQRHTRLVGQTPPGIGHVDGGRFVPRMNQRDVTADRGVVNREDLVAGKGEEVLDAVGGQRVHDALGSGP